MAKPSPKPKQTTAIDHGVGSRIAFLRAANGLSQSALASALGVSFQQVQKYETGKNRVGAGRLRRGWRVTGLTLTLVMTEGYERRSGDLFPFEGTEEGRRRGGERRIVLVHTDPRPWMEAMPELFRERAPEPVMGTTGRTREELRREMNLLLAEDAAGGRWRLEAFEGLGEVGLIEVDLVDLDREGRTRRHLFADHLRVERRKSGVVLVLTDGIQMRGSRKTPFLEGRFRIFLPGARHVGWEEAGLLALKLEESPPEKVGAGTSDSDGR